MITVPLNSINVYDFDKTIYDGDSTIDFWIFCMKRNKSILLYVPKIIFAYFISIIGLQSKTEFKEVFFSFMDKIPDPDLEIYLFWKENSCKIKKWYLDLKSNDDLVISASPDFLLRPICNELGVRLIASKIDKRTGIFEGENCRGEEKVRRFKNEYSGILVNKFYSDSVSDMPFAELSNEAYLVCGSKIKLWK
ncbi:HAD-IB family phosphatase [Methanomicrobium mobile]|uniref:HAD-IB family phosphatase n=1 Tax=Methanomicrobium mobile TaxID=2205 RepID=UPI000B29FBA3|nr:HAD-IB family phosphatase [Methanomicrobium mobile]